MVNSLFNSIDQLIEIVICGFSIWGRALCCDEAVENNFRPEMLEGAIEGFRRIS